MSLLKELTQLESLATEEAKLVSDPEAWEALKNKYLARKGILATLTTQLKTCDAAEKPLAGREANRIKQVLTALFETVPKSLAGGQSETEDACGPDLSMPGTALKIGGLHPITQVIHEICDIFASLGFEVATGPEMETEHYNFDSLNVPKDHPARNEVDTFYLDNKKLLRSQTSTVQIRVMENHKPPLKIISPGRVYRPDATDATHSFMFHQIEGLMVDQNVSFAELKGVLMAFAQRFFGKSVKLRFRPHFFPFTEPSAEVDVSCDLWGAEGGSGAKKNWLEILGAGMVHPNVLKSVGLSPKKYNGFAFGLGVERIAMLRWGIKDIRLFYENDIRFLRQFA
ncbi:MAG: phenylalanyl-tRNA synthetase alpha chain [Candidatus Omnitrophota bacterium]|jgi:phenylalanyl-tRNA synthetase alpha chain